MLLTTTCYDVARKKGQDCFEFESAKIATGILKEFGLNENNENLFTQAIALKSQPEKYHKKLNEMSIDKKNHNAFDYIRKIIILGVNLDSVRYVSQFNIQTILNTLTTIEEYIPTLHDNVVIKLIIAIHQFVYDQHDMQTPCEIKDKKNVTIAAHKSKLSKLAVSKLFFIFLNMVPLILTALLLLLRVNHLHLEHVIIMHICFRNVFSSSL